MTRRRATYTVTTTITLLAAAIAWVGVIRPARRAEAAEVAARAEASAERARRSLDIAFYLRRAAEDTAGADDPAMAAGLLLLRAREGGGRPDYVLAERYARASLARRVVRNGKARITLASALLAQHHFPEAMREARQLVDDDPSEFRYRALLAELLVEVGDYDAAGVQFDSLGAHLATLAVAPRYARYLEFRGEDAKALRTLERALAIAGGESGLPPEQLAWFGLRLADAQLRHGRLREAGRTLEDALRQAPADMRLWSLEARRHALLGEWRDALAAIDKVGASADVQTRALAGDAWAALGDSARAQAAWDATERYALDNPEPFNRQWTLFRLEHGRDAAATRAILEGERTGRHDVFGLAQLALARALTGDAPAADAAMREALAVGTRDGWLWYVAGRVAEANGHRDEARRWYAQALALNPAFHPTLAADARARAR